MQLSKIKPDRWYQTKRGDAQCVQVDTITRRIRFLIGGKLAYLQPSEVLSEIHATEAPSAKVAAGSQGDADLLQAAEFAVVVYEELIATGQLKSAQTFRAEFAKRTLNTAIAGKKGLK